MVRAMSTKERPSVAVKLLASARNTARIMRTAPLPKTKKIQKLPIPGKGKKKLTAEPKAVKVQVKKVAGAKSYNLRKNATNSRELRKLLTDTNKSTKKSTSVSRKSSVKKNPSKNKVISSPRVAPVKSLPKMKSLPKGAKKANASKAKVNPSQTAKNSNKSAASKSRPKVVKPASIPNPIDNGKVIKVINAKKPTFENKKSVTFVLQKKERKPSRYFELLANQPPKSRERVAPVSELIKQNAKKGKDNLSPRKLAAENDDEHNETRQEDMHVQPRLTAVKSLKSIAELQKIKQSQTSRLYLISFQRKEQEWSFEVFSSKRPYTNIFKVTVSTILKCACIDHRSYKKICSHITFVVDQIAKDHQLIDEFQATKMILSASFQRFDQAVMLSLRGRMNNGTQSPELKIQASNEVEEKDCPICFCEMEIIEKIDNCMACRKFFHHQCLSAYKAIAKACPLCRSQFNTGKVAGESLEKIEEVLA